MTDTQRANMTTEMPTQDEPMPSSEQKTPESDSPQDVETSSQVPSGQVNEEGLPSDSKERTQREFEKLRNQLREERERREYAESVFTSLQTKREPDIVPVLDPETGYVNETALTDIQRRAIKAEERAQNAENAVQKYFKEQEDREVYRAYPQLNPDSDKLDKSLHVETRKVMLDSMLNPQDYGNRQLSFKEAADLASGKLTGTLDEAKKLGAKEALESLGPKEQASLEATGSPDRRNDALTTQSDLAYKSRKGDVDAITERLVRLKKANSG